jgi:signal transduction histidine kinase
MTDRVLDQLTLKLAECLDQIDEQAGRLVAAAGSEDPDLLSGLDAAAGRLQDLVASILDHAHDRARLGVDLNRVVGTAVERLLGDAGRPLVVRQRLWAGLLPVQCRGVPVEQAVLRLLDLAAAHAGAGGELLVGTRPAGDGVRLEVRCHGQGSTHLAQRALTLQEFVADLRGHCTVEVGPTGELLLALELPAVLAPDDR